MKMRWWWKGKNGKQKNSFNFIFCSFFFLPHNFLKYHHKFLPVWGKTFHLYRNEWENEKKRNTKILYFPVGLWNRHKFHSLAFVERTENERQEHIIKYRTLEKFLCVQNKMNRHQDVWFWLFNNEEETCEQRNYKLWMQKVRAMNWWNFASIWILKKHWSKINQW